MYPETANVRLEDMNALFGDSTTAMPTPASQAQASLLSGQDSPVPSLHLGQHTADSAIPGLDIDPPKVSIKNGKPVLSRQSSEGKEGVGGWISNIVKRTKREDGNEGDSRGGSYKRVDQQDEEEQ